MKTLFNFFIIILVTFFISCGSGVKVENDEIKVDTLGINREKMTLGYTDMDILSSNIGNVTHLIKDTMDYGVIDTVELVVSYNTPMVIILNDVGTFSHNPLNVITQPIKVTPLMKARLVDPSKSFLIDPITDSIQIVEMVDNTYTLWQWKVTPKKGGSTQLILNVDMIIGDNHKSLEIFEDKVYVDIKKKDVFKIWIEKNWHYITYVIGLIGAIIAWLYKEKIITYFKKGE